MSALDPRLLQRARPARVAIVADAVLGVTTALLVVTQAVLIARIAARAFDGASLDDLTTPLIILVVVTACRAATVWAFELIGRRAAARIMSVLRDDLVERRLRESPAALDGVESAGVATTAVNGVDALEGTFARYLPQIVLATVVPVAVIVLVAFVDVVSAILMVVTLPLVPVFMWLVGKYTERRTRRRWRALTLLATHFLDVVRGLPTLRAFNRGEHQAARIAEVADAYRRATMSTLRVSFLSGVVLELAATLGIALVAVTVGVRLVGGSIAFEPALTVLVLVPELYLPLRNLGAQYHASADGRAVAERLLDLIEQGEDQPVLAMSPPAARDVSVRLEGVDFAYTDRPEVLRAADLELRPGEIVALTGSSGTGKSTVASLLLGLVTPTCGRVRIGAVDLADCDRDAWLARVSWVPQDPTLFRLSVRDNIRLGAPDAPDDRVRTAARAAGADAFIGGLPDGYDTVIGDGGRQLSAGERQRLAVARALVQDADLVILDEPTAHLSPASAAAVCTSLRDYLAGRTALLITHHPDVVSLADRVVRLEAGRIVDGSVALEAAP